MSPAATVPDCLKIRLIKACKLSPRGCEAPAYRPLPGTAANRPPRPTEAASRKQSRKPAGRTCKKAASPQVIPAQEGGKGPSTKGLRGRVLFHPTKTHKKPTFGNLISQTACI